MPLSVGNQWSYLVTARRQSTPDVMVNRTAAVGYGPGFEISGPLGISRMAWSKGQLIASQLAGTRFDPPITLLDPTVPEKNSAEKPGPGKKAKEIILHWDGQISNPLSTGTASATLKHESGTYNISGIRQPAIKTTLTLTIGKHHVELLTWWVRGIGIAEQTQRTDTVQDVALSWLSGPTKIGSKPAEQR